VKYRAILIVFAILLALPAVPAFDVKDVYIRIDRSGDAVITAHYDENPFEYLAIGTAAMAGTTLFQEQVRSGTLGDVRILCSDYGTSVVSAGQFAEAEGNWYETPIIDIAGSRPGSAIAAVTPFSADPDVTFVFPDGYVSRVKATGGTIPSVSHTLGPQQPAAPPEPAGQCRVKKDLPLSGVLPDALAPAASVAAGIVLTAAAAGLAGGAINLWFGNAVAFIENAFGSVISSRLQEKSKDGCTLDRYTERHAFLGFSVREVIVLITGALLIGILFFYASRDPPDPTVLAIYILMGGIALILHEVGHWYVTKRYASYTEVRFWSMGALIMVLTAWICGNVFAQPTMTLARHHETPDRRRNGIIMLAGPIVSMIIACACLCIVPFGGMFATAGMIGFTINLTTGVFELLPIVPCDGSGVRGWNPWLWAAIFVPPSRCTSQ